MSNNEAQLRKRAQAAERERDTLTGRRTELQRQLVADLAADQNVDPEAFLRLHENIDGLLDGDGIPDPQNVAQAVTHAVEEYGLRQLRPGVVPAEGRIPENLNLGDSWADAFDPLKH